MKTLLQLRGIITVLNTPFTDADRIDVAGLRVNVLNAIDAGVAGFLAPAMASEVDKLSMEERETIVATIVDAVAGRVPVIGGASAPTSEARRELGRRLIGLGCDGILVSISFEDERQYARDLRAVADLAPPFLMVQDWDANGPGVPVPLIARLFEEVEAFRSLKIETVPAGVKYSAVLEATGGRLHVSGGWAVMQMIEALDRGVHAFMPTGMHRIYTRIYSLYAGGRRDEARALFDRLLPVLAFSNQHLDISIHFFKRLMHGQGVYAADRVRAPIVPFDAYHERVADELIDYVMQLEREIAASHA
ncbi:MAG TPA: dihydrodipicolinate synthase family protein [Candidatus Hydrogenedentes bacterium]|nr:dihydrodipicolinate synthase family protein [Candidatus Hydrogenedentota bacterium]HNT86984.1 dihydrodipicolinate synthase family protein [Candidatus Hydrogenedentota bacterium]